MEFYFHEIEKDVLILSADGGLNSSNAAEFLQQIEKVIHGGVQRIIIDCSNLQYISSYGLTVLVRLHSRMSRRGGDVRLAGVHGAMAKVLEVTRLNTLLAMYPDVNQARLSFRPAQA